MGSLWDENDEIKPMETNPVVDCAHTQPIESQISSPPSPDEKAKFEDAHEIVQDTVPFDDTVLVEDAFETQVLNLAGETQVMDFGAETQVMDFGCETQVMDFGCETQVMDFGGETQVMDFGGETQVVDFGGETQVLDQVLDDINCIENMETQLLEFEDEVVSDTDSEESDTTEVFDDNKHLTHDESVRRGSGQVVNEEKICCTPFENSEKGLTEQAYNSIHEKQNAGSVHMHFTSVRAASLRASGLAARLKGTNSESPSVPSNSQCLEQLSGKDNAVSLLRGSTIGGEKVNQEHDMERCNEKIRRSTKENNCRTGNSTARKLFNEDSDAEEKGFPHNSSTGEEGEGVLQLPCNLAGLSYIDSQEPGELSQANALDFVDKFLQVNIEEFDKEVDRGKSAGENSKFVSSAKGPQRLAKKAIDKSIVQNVGIFDWDDSRENEEGGDFFCRRKTDFFGGGSHGWRSLPQSQKSKGNRQEGQKDNKKQVQGKKKKMGVIHSDSKLLLHNSKFDKKTEHEDEIKHKKNLASEFDKQFDINSPRGQLDANVEKNNDPEMLDVGIDTQMAAEAIEALFNGEGISNCDAITALPDVQGNPKSSPEGSMGEKTKNTLSSKKPSSRKRVRLSDAGVASRESQQAKKTRIGAKSGKRFSISSPEYSKTARKKCETELVITKSKKAKSNAKKHLNINGNKSLEKIPSVAIDLRTEGSIKRHLPDVGNFVPVARRTRQSMVVNQLQKADKVSSDCGEESSYQTRNVAIREKIISFTGVQKSKVLNAKSSKLGSNKTGKVGNTKPSQQELSDFKFEAVSNGIKLDVLNFPKRRRSRRNMSIQVYGPNNSDGPSEPSVQADKIGQHVNSHKRLRSGAKNICNDIKLTRRMRSSTYGEQNLDGKFAREILKGGPGEAPLRCNSSHKDGRMISEIITGKKVVGISDRKSDANCSSATKMSDEFPRENCKPSDSSCATPVNNKVPVNAASPVCMGNEYFKQTCKRRLLGSSLLKEIRGLSATVCEPTSTPELRKRRDMTDVRVLYSHHLDEDIIKKQKKILARLGVSVASSMTDATHFIADQFVRTRNMLEAIAFGKPVVSHLWLESCGQAGCFVDEKSHILRDNKKEKEFGFSMPASLARACQHPLLQDRKVFITPNTKPGKEIISNLVKAVKGQAVERIGRSTLNADKIPDDLLVLSCEEDYEICVPLLEKGAAVYSSELLLNGIVTQKLEFERHLLFSDQVKKTRSTIWLKKDGNKFLPVTKNK
ncbi:hypothetical protein GBA52_004339 [Prunus armeniaca]|nr:hypothetical protein GBA52_004339 [Prunus armeniaca]